MIEKVLDKVFVRLTALSDDELNRLIAEQQEDGWTKIMLCSGALDAGEQESKALDSWEKSNFHLTGVESKELSELTLEIPDIICFGIPASQTFIIEAKSTISVEIPERFFAGSDNLISESILIDQIPQKQFKEYFAHDQNNYSTEDEPWAIAA